MANAKFFEGARVRVQYNGRVRNGVVSSVLTGFKRGARREYQVTAESNGTSLGWYTSKELQSR